MKKKTTIILLSGLVFASIFISGIKETNAGKEEGGTGFCTPNPSGSCDIKCEKFKKNVILDVYVVDGDKVGGRGNTNSAGEAIVDMSGLASGVYFITDTNSEGDSTSKQVIVAGKSACYSPSPPPLFPPPSPPDVSLYYKREYADKICAWVGGGYSHCRSCANDCSKRCIDNGCSAWGTRSSFHRGSVKIARENNESVTADFIGDVRAHFDTSIISTSNSGFNAPNWRGDKWTQGFSTKQTFTQDGIYVFRITGTVKNDANSETASASDTFTLQIVSNYLLDVSKQGDGGGTITSNPSGINCGTDCSEIYESGTSITLTASPSYGSVFAGWTGDCSGLNPNCVLTINSNKSAEAVFNLKKYSYSCNTSTWSCGEDANGQYTSLVDCASDCREPQPLSSELPSCTFSSKPSSIPKYSKSTLSWKCDNADSCSINQGVGSASPASSGSREVSPKTTTTYTLSCSGSGGEKTFTAKVIILSTQVREVRP